MERLMNERLFFTPIESEPFTVKLFFIVLEFSVKKALQTLFFPDLEL